MWKILPGKLGLFSILSIVSKKRAESVKQLPWRSALFIFTVKYDYDAPVTGSNTCVIRGN